MHPDTKHSAIETEYIVERVPLLTSKLMSWRNSSDVAVQLLFRADSGFYLVKLMCTNGKKAHTLAREVTFITEWITRTTPMGTLTRGKVADTGTARCQLREDKRQCLWAECVHITHGVAMLAARRVYRLTERTNDKRGQQMLLTEHVQEGWSTTLPEAAPKPEQVIALYADHGTH